jgi:hypothetical protein
MIKLIWPLLILLGVLFVLVFDQGNGLSSPGFWLIPIGVIGTIVATFQKHSDLNNSSLKRSHALLIGVWILAFVSIAGLYFGWFTEGFSGFIWALPALGFTIIGLVMSVIYLIRK